MARLVGLNAENVIVDSFVEQDPQEFFARAAALICVRWPGGVHVMRDDGTDDFVGMGWSLQNGMWTPPDPRPRALREANTMVQRVLAQGFVYEGLVFSLSLAAQSTLHFLYNARDRLDFPITMYTIDDGASINLTTPEDVVAFYDAAMAALLKARDRGVALKKQM